MQGNQVVQQQRAYRHERAAHNDSLKGRVNDAAGNAAEHSPLPNPPALRDNNNNGATNPSHYSFNHPPTNLDAHTGTVADLLRSSRSGESDNLKLPTVSIREDGGF